MQISYRERRIEIMRLPPRASVHMRHDSCNAMEAGEIDGHEG